MSLPTSCPVCGCSESFLPLWKKQTPLKRCGSCGVLLSDPFPSEEETRRANRAYYEAEEHPQLESARQRLYERVIAQIEKIRGGKKGKILDVGCGGGHFMKLAADRGWQVFGVEHAPGLRGWAENQFHLKRVAEDLASLREEEGSFDAVVFLDMLDETTQPAEFLRQAYLYLRSGGVVVVRVRNGLFQAWLWRLTGSRSFVFKPLLQKEAYVLRPLNFTARSLRRILEKHPWRDLKVTNSTLTFGDPYGVFRWAILSNLAKRGITFWAKAVETLTAGKILIGPSLLAVGRKPG